MNKVTVYSAPWCPYCVALEKKLKSMDVEFEYKNVDDEGVRREPLGSPVEWVEEESFFFKLSAYQQPLLDYYKANSRLILAGSRL